MPAHGAYRSPLTEVPMWAINSVVVLLLAFALPAGRWLRRAGRWTLEFASDLAHGRASAVSGAPRAGRLIVIGLFATLLAWVLLVAVGR
jgi:hypothetical protein